MAYSDQDDLRNLELPREEMEQLSDDPNLGEIFDAQVNAAIERGDAEIDQYCSPYYTVPFVPVPTVVKGWSATLAAFYLFRNRDKPDTLIDRYNKVLSHLKKIRAGDLKIPGAEDSLDASGLPASTTDGKGHEFTRGDFDANGKQVTAGTTDIW